MMRIKVGEYIRKANRVWIRDTDIEIDDKFYQTGIQTQEIADQLLKEGYADLTSFEVR